MTMDAIQQVRKLINLIPDDSYVEVQATTIPPRAVIHLSILARPSKYHSKKYNSDSPLYSPLVRIPSELAKHFKIPVVRDPERYVEEWDKIEISVSFGPWVGSSP